MNMRFTPIVLGSILVAASSMVLAAQAGDAAKAPPKARPVVATTPAKAKPAVQKTASVNDPGFIRVAEAATHQELLNTYCVACHNEGNPTAGLNFENKDLKDVPTDAAVWEKVARKLRGRMMPPPGFPRPDEQVYASFVSWLEGYLDHAAARSPDPGRVALHRLNRKEYANAVRDLFALKVDATALLPPDAASDGFDNVAEMLQVSSSFLDQYISAARSVAVEAVGERREKPLVVSLKPNPGLSQGAHIDGLPLGTRGGFVADHLFPQDGEYEITFGSTVPGAYEDPFRDDRLLALVDGKIVYDSAKAEKPTGKLPVGTWDPKKITVKVNLKAGTHRIGATYIATTYIASVRQLHPLRPPMGIVGPVVTAADIAGPFNPGPLGRTPSRDAIFTCRPASAAEETPCARKIVGTIARKAWRRPVTEADMAAPMRFYAAGHKVGGFEDGVKQALMAILASPNFLYRNTEAPAGLRPGQQFAVNDIDLASRLSFFLWSSIPDDELLKLAEQKRLKDPKVLEAQVRRMMADPRSESLVNNFAFQWLRLADLDDIDPDPAIFPDFDAELRVAFHEEMRLFLDSVLREDRSLVRLLDADYTFVNERLARHYGIPGVTGNRFRKVELKDEARWGMLGKGGILMATAYPNRTSPVLRGVWLLEQVLGTPPSPPPPGVGGLEEPGPGERVLTVRELLEVHRADPTCHACHAVMDPLGLSLENFDAIGAWRTKDRMASEVIDASAVMADGHKMNGVKDLRVQLLKGPEQFVQTFTEKLMTFALGRALHHQDMPTVRGIVRNAAANDYKLSAIVMGIVGSDQFRKSKVPGEKEPESKPPAKAAPTTVAAR